MPGREGPYYFSSFVFSADAVCSVDEEDEYYVDDPSGNTQTENVVL